MSVTAVERGAGADKKSLDILEGDLPWDGGTSRGMSHSGQRGLSLFG